MNTNSYRHIAAPLNGIAYYGKEYLCPLSSFRRQDKKFSWLVLKSIPIGEAYYSIVDEEDSKTHKFITKEDFIRYLTRENIYQVIDDEIYYTPKVVLRFPNKIITEQRFETEEKAEKYFHSIVSQYDSIDNIKSGNVEITVIR